MLVQDYEWNSRRRRPPSLGLYCVLRIHTIEWINDLACPRPQIILRERWKCGVRSSPTQYAMNHATFVNQGQTDRTRWVEMPTYSSNLEMRCQLVYPGKCQLRNPQPIYNGRHVIEKRSPGHSAPLRHAQEIQDVLVQVRPSGSDCMFEDHRQ